MKSTIIKAGLGVLLAVFVLAGCQQNDQQADDSSGADQEATTAEHDVTTPALSDSDASDMTYQDQLDAARADFAQRFEKSDDPFEVWEAVGVDWRSGALGCPKKGMNYTQSLVPGFLVVIRVGETEHHYHARRGDKPFFCPPGRVEEPAPTTKNFIM